MKNWKDIVLVAALVGLLFAWPYIDREIINKHFFDQQMVPVAQKDAALDASVEPAESVPGERRTAPAESESTIGSVPVFANADADADGTALPAQTYTLANDHLRVVFSSKGAALESATMLDYPADLAKTGQPVELSFAGAPALAYENLPGFSISHDFKVRLGADERSVFFERKAASGILFRRSVTLNDRYSLQVVDSFDNRGQAEVAVPAHLLRTGAMRSEAAHKNSYGYVVMGVDTLSPGGESVKNWGGDIEGWFKKQQKEKGLSVLPVTLRMNPREADVPVDWVAVKNKYFVQIITPEEGAENTFIEAVRTVSPEEKFNPAAAKMDGLESVTALAAFNPQTLSPGAQFNRTVDFYLGPKKFTELHNMKLHRVDVMEFGFFSPIAKILLQVLVVLHDYIWPHNYGIAIILLTLIIRIIFWPLTHKSTESMRRMQEVQPLMAELKEKHKDNPQKFQQEMFAVYKERKINPLSGCLPMLVQIPVFFALFVVLRSAIELRFASFLWINDLSEAENLLAGVLPIPLNILPLLMSATMYWQMSITPSSGDPTQQKMMKIMMPIMMLFMLYSFASGLALYWTVQNLLVIAQQMIYQYRRKAVVP